MYEWFRNRRTDRDAEVEDGKIETGRYEQGAREPMVQNDICNVREVECVQR
jgi:hypothetical protein